MSANPIQALQVEALELSGLTYDRAFAIDEKVLALEFNEMNMTTLVDIFYNKVYADPDEWFRLMFTSSLQVNIQNLTDYMLQRIGLRSYYSDRKGFPALIHRHMGFELTRRAAERWLDHMEDALESLPEEAGVISEESKAVLLDFLRYTAYYLVAGQEKIREMGSMGSRYI